MGDPIPAPRSLEAITAGAGDWYDTAGSVVAANRSAVDGPHGAHQRHHGRERLIAKIDAVTANRSAFLATAARKALGSTWRLVAPASLGGGVFNHR